MTATTKIMLIRIIIVLPCLILKKFINDLLGITYAMQKISLFQRVIFEFITLIGMIYILGFFLYWTIKYFFPSIWKKVNAITMSILPKY